MYRRRAGQRQSVGACVGGYIFMCDPLFVHVSLCMLCSVAVLAVSWQSLVLRLGVVVTGRFSQSHKLPTTGFNSSGTTFFHDFHIPSYSTSDDYSK